MRIRKFVLTGVTVLAGVSAAVAQTDAPQCGCNQPTQNNSKPARFPRLRSFFGIDRSSSWRSNQYSNSRCGQGGTVVAKSSAAPPLANDSMARAPVSLPELPKPAPSLELSPGPNLKADSSALALRVDTIPGSAIPAPVPIRALQPADLFPALSVEAALAKGNAKAEEPAPLPALMAEPTVSEHKTMKPAQEPKEEAKPAAPEPAKPTPTAVARKVLQVLTEPTTSVQREQAADSLTSMDVASCPGLPTALIKVATGSDADSARKSAIKALVRTECTTPDVIQALERLTEDTSASIRVEAAIGLARLRLKAGKN